MEKEREKVIAEIRSAMQEAYPDYACYVTLDYDISD